MSNASTANKMNTCPEVMTIILKREKGSEFDINFEYPLYLDINDYIIEKPDSGNDVYELICVLSNYDPSKRHFISFCKSPIDQKWYCYNDTHVSESENPISLCKKYLAGIPYVLFYQKCKKTNIKNTKIKEDKDSPNKISLNYHNDKKLMKAENNNLKKNLNTMKRNYNVTFEKRKNKNEKLKVENTQNKDKNESLENKLYIVKNKNQNEKIKIDDSNNDYKDEINKLKKELKLKDEELKDLKSRIPVNLENGGKLITVIFFSNDQKIHYAFICKDTDKFSVVENLLYDIFPEYQDAQNFFTANGNIINRCKTLEQNNIKFSDIILINKLV